MTTRLIVLAAGKGTRMKSAMPKVLHCLAGKPLLGHVIDTGLELNPASITVVIGHGADQVKETIKQPVQWALQSEQLGTGHAVREGLEGIGDNDTVLITYGDVPLTRASTYQALLDVCDDNNIGLLTLMMEDPTGYGRILREGGAVVGVVEQKDATADQLSISEVNAGVVAIKGGSLRDLLSRISNENAQGEYYLTDIHELAVKDGLSIKTVHPQDGWETDGVNSRSQLARLERIHQRHLAEQLMDSGVTLADPSRIDIRGTVSTGTDILIDVNCVFEGDCVIGNNVKIGQNCLISGSKIADGTEIRANCVLENADVGSHAVIGPFARLRPGTKTDSGVRIGNFVETKNTQVGEGSKINHLSYVGDAILGKSVNVGAGTITCNYDGANKHQTVIGDNAFIGSNSALVAPVAISEGVTIGAGSTITRNVPANRLSLTRPQQTDIDNWSRPAKK
ncbi:bifunctional UDP-N-acetylglucosamine diphosphorylase/glucosamine-1-phosphate N-acetyltransferase GlmU [Granulosicoccus antarcticus]|uniref:Bifunctional protein GlmU n=1 Tax=Granulosicoccus antarcticus IMCC3135 TaxID=1192854 RepID=A0A2Z2P314_9GAMM|nr:bifunctional UDP-N-acetylglucosamine diphosphorylase/glucosamine-1-phosphate N-acetyltransferase GlmU [Granulosicoccus antarcticus]ASJ76738.1 Bifunctional protein GlmU [Granulosicoccus antarcticus IMCC3135]